MFVWASESRQSDLAIPLGVIDMFMSTQFAKEMAYLEQGTNPLGFIKTGLLFSVKMTTFCLSPTHGFPHQNMPLYCQNAQKNPSQKWIWFNVLTFYPN